MTITKKTELNLSWKFKEVFPTISGYTTTSNCVEGGYPFEDAIRSFAWCDEIVVCDNFSKDGTREKLEELKKELPQLQIYDLAMSGQPDQDGQFKSLARAMCMSDYLVQFDSDEICMGSSEKWKRITKNFPNKDILALPVVEPIGSLDNLRINESHTPWKWRVSRAKPEVTHGIPLEDQMMVGGVKYSKGGSDGCNYCHIVSEKALPFDLNDAALKMLELKNSKQFDTYTSVVNSLVSGDEPYILHLGHVNLENKIRLYCRTWNKFWNKLYNKPQDNNTYFPGIKFEDVTEEMIAAKVKEIIETTPSVKINLTSYKSCSTATA